MKHWGLLGRAIFLGTLPTLFISWVLGSFFLTTRFQELNDNSTYHGHTLATSYANALSGTLSNIGQPDTKQNNAAADKILGKLQSIPSFIIEDSNIRSVIIYDEKEQIIAQAGPTMLALTYAEKHLPFNHSLNPNNKFRGSFSRETRASTRIIAPIYNHIGSAEKSNKITGWIEVEVDASSTIIAKYQTTLLILVVIFIALIINIYGSFRYSREITSTLHKVMLSIGTMISGKLDTHIQEDSYGELKELQEGINTLSHSILEGHRELQQNVDQASEDLRETLETIEIQNIELDLARKEALEASRIKSEFLANMSHEIRTPLNGVIGFTNLLLKSQLSHSQRDYLDTIQKSSESLLAIINDILDFSKIEAGKLVLDQIPLNLSEVVSDVLTMLAPMAYDKKLEQASLFYSDVPQNILGDPLRLKQILTNLVNNAIKFTTQGEVIVRVMLDETKDGIAVIKITVSDTGIGLSTEQQQHLFSAFRQADTTTARRFGGTGLGLVISKHLVEQMRGQIGVESVQGEGSTFWFTFRAEVHTSHDEQNVLIPHNTHKIVLYDENTTVRNALKNTLQKQKYALIECPNFSDLSTILSTPPAETAPSAMLVGISPHAPKHHEIANLIQRNTNNVPIILLGNHIDQVIISEILKSAPPPLIPKPFAQKKTLSIIKEVVDAENWQLVGQEQATDNVIKIGSITPENVKTTPKTTTPPSSGLNILAVDDNPANLKLISVLLSDLGINVTSCDNGLEAVELAKTHRYDLILMDIQMPGTDGVEATQLIRQQEEGKRKSPIIAVTAHALANEKQALLNSGMDDYVTKPINENQLLHIIKHWTGKDLTTPITPALTIPSPIKSEVVSLSMGLKLANNKQDLADDMLIMLFDSLTKDRISLREDLNSQDYSRMLERVHKLHGATRYTGVPNLQRSAKALEEDLKHKQYDNVNVLCEALIADIEDIIQWCVENKHFEVPIT
ncbi:hypothetical protein A9Q81_15070 [Gammaproteobacteria bacterium 42_54_T18]|nr:hypothetical protein A9Q81_15070 [Gammaproteobacteria bacterium 42_54_T18]